MLKKLGIYTFLLTFIFQAVFFNMILFAGWGLARFEAQAEQEADGELALSRAEAAKLRWLNENEFMLNGKICDVHNKTTEGDLVHISFKTDEKEQGFLEKMAGHCKRSGGKKLLGFTAPCPAPQSLSYSFKNSEKDFSHTTGHTRAFVNNKGDISSPPPKA